MSKDLFDDSTMTFGEHLEVLRVHLIKAILGLVVGVCLALFVSKDLLFIIQKPVTDAMRKYFQEEAKDKELLNQPSFYEQMSAWFSGKKLEPVVATPPAETPSVETPPATTTEASKTAAEVKKTESSVPPPVTAPGKTIPNEAAALATSDPNPPPSLNAPLQVDVDAVAIARSLHEVYPKSYPEVPKDAKPLLIRANLTNDSLKRLHMVINEQNVQPRTDSVDEAFMMYLKVSLIAGVIIASPVIFYQLWQFVAAGLYPHERKYVYYYLPVSLGLFLFGCVFAFKWVIPNVLNFLFGFNLWLGLRPEMKISNWLSFATILPLMFGISFQLPLVMVFLEKINVFTVSVYINYSRHAIMAIAIISMILTPSDPVSMMMMMIPLCFLYGVGILMCGRKGGGARSPFAAKP